MRPFFHCSLTFVLNFKNFSSPKWKYQVLVFYNKRKRYMFVNGILEGVAFVPCLWLTNQPTLRRTDLCYRDKTVSAEQKITITVHTVPVRERLPLAAATCIMAAVLCHTIATIHVLVPKWRPIFNARPPPPGFQPSHLCRYSGCIGVYFCCSILIDLNLYQTHP